MKRVFLFMMLVAMFLSTLAQNYSVGTYSIYQADDEYHLLTGNDTLLLDKYGITIKLQGNVTEAGRTVFCQDHNLTFIRETTGSYSYFKFSRSSNYIAICDSLLIDSRVKEFIFDFRLKLYSFTPDDDDFEDQWYLDQIDVPEAWDITLGSDNVTVAVIDDGLFLDHDDIGDDDEILENVFHNPGEDEWTYWDDPDYGNGDDDDNNGKVDDWKGWNYCNYISNPPSHVENNSVIPEQDWAYHGTAVSGVIAAKTNNNNDMAGIAGGDFSQNKGGAKILPIKIFDWRFNPFYQEWVLEASTSSIPAAIDYAVEMGANIINMSFGLGGVGGIYPPLLNAIEASLEDAYVTHNVLIVAAAGNEGYSNSISYPAWSDWVIAVGATDQNDEETDFSNNGDELELAAPGVNILTLDDNSTTEMDGTSFSSPMVAATVALMLSIKPDLDNEDIREILKNTAEKVGNHTYDQDGWNKYLGYGRINTYQAVCEVLGLLPPITVNTNDVWDEPVFSLNDIVVETDNILTITSTVYLGTNARFIIEPGAKVIVDGGTLTNYKFCGHEENLWPGVEVWGNSSAHQYTINGENAQGQLILKNGAIIENAVSAVELWKPGDNDKTGGIVQATDAIFRNNAKSVHALNYSNFHPYNPTVTMDNICYFSNCTFEITSDYIPSHTFYKHVDLSHVKGIKFKASDFILADGIPGVSQWNHGIAAYNAGFSVYAICTSLSSPCTEYDKCTFKGFRNGIYASSTGSTNAFSVNRAVFENNIYGIKVEGVDNFSVLLSDFYMGNNADDAEECESKNLNAAAYGISSSNATGFAIEENYFTKAGGVPSAIYVGIRIDNTLSTDEIYRNSFEGVSYANYAENRNFVPGNPYTGLSYFCNENTGNFADFYVEPDDDPTKQSGIQSKQGDDEHVTGNKFSPSGAAWHFYNGGDHLVGYYYCDYCSNENPDDDKIYNVTDKGKNFDNSCFSHYGGPGENPKNLVLTPDQKQETELLYAANLTDYNNVKASYDNLKDGGNTEALKTDVETAWPQDMWELRAELLGKSPHLSMEVLKKAADKTDVLPESVLFEILSANPDELKKEELLKYLEDKENPLPDYMIDILRQVAAGTTYKTVLEQQMARYNQAKTRAAYDMIRSNLNDTVADLNELRNWLDNLGGIRADEQIVDSYLQEGNTTDALALANMLPQLYNYDGVALIEYGYYMDMLNLNILLKQEGRSIQDLETAEIDNLMIIAKNSRGTAGAAAKGILESNYGHHFCDCLNIEGTVGLKSSGAINTGAFTEMFGADVEVQPNPASDWTTFNFNLPGKETVGHIKIVDVSGKLIESFTVSGNQGQKIWDTRNIDSGIYFYTFTVNGISKSGKIVISK